MPALPIRSPYQGSKRLLAGRILATVADRPRAGALYEPFAGSAAVTLAAADAGLADRYVLGDSLPELVDIWQAIVAAPDRLAGDYAAIWHEQAAEGRGHFDRVRADFNRAGGAARLLYLLARCVKNAPRFGPRGFSQSADHRRRGMRPERMRRQIEGAHGLLAGRTAAIAGDAWETLRSAGPDDLVYLDPPWQGTTEGKDKRYHQGLERQRLLALLEDLNERGVPWLLSYDGRCGERRYGEELPASLGAARLELEAGRSSQATLSGRDDVTVESLYVSRTLLPLRRARRARATSRRSRQLPASSSSSSRARSRSCEAVYAS